MITLACNQSCFLLSTTTKPGPPVLAVACVFFFSSRRRHTRSLCDWSSDVCSSDLFTKLIFDAETHRIVGGGIVGAGAGDLISEVVHAIEMGSDATDIGKTIHPHPTTSESIGMGAEAFEGVCTVLPPQKKK